MVKITKAIPVRVVKLDAKTYYSISVGNEIVWVHPALIESNMLVLKDDRFYLDICDAPDGSTIHYLYPGKNKLTALQSMKYLYVSDGSWIASEHKGIFYYLIMHYDDTLTVNDKMTTFEIRDNKIISVERHAVHGHIDKEIELDGEW